MVESVPQARADRAVKVMSRGANLF